jgi:Tfp pilus assembly protein PilN
MPSLMSLLVVWGVLTGVLIVLLIYRSTLAMHEDDQLFLDESESHMQKEQTALLKRLHTLQIPVRILFATSGLLILVIFGMWIWQGLNGGGAQ